MLNLVSNSSRPVDSAVVDAPPGAGDSPLTEDGSGASVEKGGRGRGGPSRALFGEMLASAIGPSARARVAGQDGNRLPVPALQERELGAGVRLITPQGADRPGEDALFAFAVSQGLDASLVASVLWPGASLGSPEKSGETGVGDGVAADSAPAEVLAALLASIASGQVAAADGARVGATLIAGLGGPRTGQVGLDSSVEGAVARANNGTAAGGLSGTQFGIGILGVSAADGASAVAGGAAARGLSTGDASAIAELDGFSALTGTAIPGSAAFGGTVQPPEGAPGLPPDVELAEFLQPSRGFAAGASGLFSRSGSDEIGADAGLDPIKALGRGAELKLQGGPLAGASVQAIAVGGLATSLPAQWVLAGGVARSWSGATLGEQSGSSGSGETDDDSAVVPASDIEPFSGSGHVAESGHKPHQNGVRAVNGAADILDLGAEARDALNDADSGSAADRLSQKLAEGIAQRISAAVASNSWKLQVELKPAHLGHVSIEMSMHHGQLEAVFDASQASARTLISEGLDRLKQDLQRAGMNVAHLGLNSDAGAGSGGKSTPRGRDTGSSAANSVSTVEDSVGVAAGRPRVGPDGLDVMV